VHAGARAFPDADKATRAVLLIQTHHAVAGPIERHDEAHIHAYAALVAHRYRVAAPVVGVYPDGALVPVARFVPSIGAYALTSSTARTLGGIGFQFFQIEGPSPPWDFCRSFFAALIIL